MQRNEEFKNAWKKEGLSNKELGERFKLSIGGVKGLKQRLRAKDAFLYGKSTKNKQVDKSISGHITKSTNPQVDISPSQQIHKRITFYLKPETIKRLKLLAVERDSNISQLAREIIEEYLEK